MWIYASSLYTDPTNSIQQQALLERLRTMRGFIDVGKMVRADDSSILCPPFTFTPITKTATTYIRIPPI